MIPRRSQGPMLVTPPHPVEVNVGVGLRLHNPMKVTMGLRCFHKGQRGIIAAHFASVRLPAEQQILLVTHMVAYAAYGTLITEADASKVGDDDLIVKVGMCMQEQVKARSLCHKNNMTMTTDLQNFQDTRRKNATIPSSANSFSDEEETRSASISLSAATTNIVDEGIDSPSSEETEKNMKWNEIVESFEPEETNKARGRKRTAPRGRGRGSTSSSKRGWKSDFSFIHMFMNKDDYDEDDVEFSPNGFPEWMAITSTPRVRLCRSLFATNPHNSSSPGPTIAPHKPTNKNELPTTKPNSLLPRSPVGSSFTPSPRSTLHHLPIILLLLLFRSPASSPSFPYHHPPIMRLLLFLWLLALAWPAAATEVSSAYEALRSHGLPIGLLPKGVRDFAMDDDGRFEARLDTPCIANFESEMRYNASVAGTISAGQIAGLTGVAAQDLFLWFPVLAIRLDNQTSGIIHFDVGVVDKRFPLSLFESPPDCSPDSSQSQPGELRYQLEGQDASI
ncbi:uncharacterized protein LOC122019561 [Zingiber officinale]|uniref:uncharacterized protein LOC122019561 n=1 Tax=Zingiber officinale TaxID=94328 RepID=UPI001C4D6F17|nr:uncharacterized protein LOC122019561 [Zingiber officinale]